MQHIQQSCRSASFSTTSTKSSDIQRGWKFHTILVANKIQAGLLEANVATCMSWEWILTQSLAHSITSPVASEAVMKHNLSELLVWHRK